MTTMRKGDIDQTRREAGRLLPTVVASRIELEKALEAADPKAARHSVVRDIQKAFVRLEDDLLMLSSPEAKLRSESEITIAP